MDVRQHIMQVKAGARQNVQDALSIINDKLTTAKDVAIESGRRGVDYKKSTEFTKVTSPDGTVTESIIATEEMSIEPQARSGWFG